MKELKTWKEVIQALFDGEQVELFNNATGKWVDYLYFPNLRSTDLLATPSDRYRIKPRTIMIGDIEVPEPVRDVSELEKGETCYLPNLNRSELYDAYAWSGHDIGLRLFKRGLVHKTKEAAILHAKALIKISGGSCD